jgi:hypothetical protein
MLVSESMSRKEMYMAKPSFSGFLPASVRLQASQNVYMFPICSIFILVVNRFFVAEDQGV